MVADVINSIDSELLRDMVVVNAEIIKCENCYLFSPALESGDENGNILSISSTS